MVPGENSVPLHSDQLTPSGRRTLALPKGIYSASQEYLEHQQQNQTKRTTYKLVSALVYFFTCNRGIKLGEYLDWTFFSQLKSTSLHCNSYSRSKINYCETVWTCIRHTEIENVQVQFFLNYKHQILMGWDNCLS